jgi:hypothetical protein
MKESKFFSLNLRDVLRGVLMTALTAASAGIYQSLDSGVLPTVAQLKISGLIGLASGLSYLLKNLFTAPTQK